VLAEGLLDDRRLLGVQRLFDLHEKSWQREIGATVEGIDALVGELYGLTEEEIALVERWWQRLGTID
jgi:hypothetical protein